MTKYWSAAEGSHDLPLTHAPTAERARTTVRRLSGTAIRQGPDSAWPLPALVGRDGLAHCGQQQIGPKCLIRQRPCLSPGIQERAQRFPVCHIDQEPADADSDLSLARSWQRNDHLDVDVLRACRHHLTGHVERVVETCLPDQGGHGPESVLLDVLGYANRGTVYRLVSEALETQTVETVDQLRSLEVVRLDKLQLGVWQKAMDGDVPSAILAVRVIMARCHLLGLEGPGALGVERGKPRTLVVPPVP